MRPVSFEGADVVLQAKGCDDLPAMRSDEGRSLITMWEMSPLELEQVKQSRRVCLRVVSRMHPPVSVWVPDVGEAPSPRDDLKATVAALLLMGVTPEQLNMQEAVKLADTITAHVMQTIHSIHQKAKA